MNIETNQLRMTNYELPIRGEKYFFTALCGWWVWGEESGVHFARQNI